MTMIILHMVAFRVNGTVSFVCQHLAGCHTSAEYNLNCTINISTFAFSPRHLSPKKPKKLPSPLRAWRQNSENMPPRLGKQKLRVTASWAWQISGSWNRFEWEREPLPTLILLAAALPGKSCRQVLPGLDSMWHLFCYWQKMPVMGLVGSWCLQIYLRSASA